jgi:hypothetical protein
VIGVLGLQGEWSPLNLPGNNGNTIVKPSVCQTATYTAGSGDVAVIAFSATGSPNAPVTDVLYISAMVSENGGQFQPKTSPLPARGRQELRLRCGVGDQRCRVDHAGLLPGHGHDRAHLIASVDVI